MLFHILRHIQTNHGVSAAVDLLCQRPAELGFPHAGGPGEQQAGNGPVFVPDAGKAPAHRLRHDFHRLRLAHHMCFQQTFQIQQPLPLPCGEPPHGDAGSGGHHPGDIGGGHRPAPAIVTGLCHHGLHFIPELRRLFKPPLPDRLVELLFQLPSGGSTTAQAHFLHSGPGGSLVQKINGLIRQKQVRKIPHGKPDGFFQGFLGDSQPVMPLQARLQRPEDGQGGFAARLLHHHRTEPALQCRILFNILPIFLQRGGPQHLQLPPAQGGLKDVGGINGPLRRPGAHNGVHFVHKENHISGAVYFRQHIPQPLFKFPPVFGARHQAGHVQAHEPLVFQLGRHVAHRHPLRQALGNSRFPHPRLPHQGGIILVLSAEDADYRVDLPIPANHRLHGRGL